MSAKEYVKQDAQSLGYALGDLVNAIRGDGVSVARLKELLGVVEKSTGAINEIKDVPEAAGEHITGAMLDRMGDAALTKALEEEAAAEEPPA